MGKATASVAVLYSSDYGYSDRLSQTLARGITKAGAATEMVDVLSVDTQVLPHCYIYAVYLCCISVLVYLSAYRPDVAYMLFVVCLNRLLLCWQHKHFSTE